MKRLQATGLGVKKYMENASKNHLGGLGHRKVQQKSVKHYANKEIHLAVSSNRTKST